MAITTRNYNITQANPASIINALQTSISDLGWFASQPYGYLTTFTNTAGSVKIGSLNKRYLVSPSATTAPSGTGAVFDVTRNAVGAVATVTLVTGGSGYYIRGQINASSSSTTITVPDTTGINPGMVVTKLAGTGTLQANTIVSSVTNSTTLVVDRAPSVALSGATLTFADTLTLAATDIGGSTYTTTGTGTAGATTITVASVDNILIGQRVTGTGIAPLAAVTAISGLTVTVSVAHASTVSGTLTFSDEITVTTTGIVNITGVTGTASGTTITNVATIANLYVGAEITLTGGTPTYLGNPGRVIVASTSGSGPYTVTLRNDENTFKGFDSSASITFSAHAGSGVSWFALDRFTSPSTYAWAVAKINNGSGKLGNTFWGFYVSLTGNQPTLSIKSMTGFSPSTNVAQGLSGLDWYSAAGITSTVGSVHSSIIGSMYNTPLTLRTRQSATDPNFATIAFFDGNTNRNPFVISKYNSSTQPWSLNDVFLGNAYEIYQNPAYATSDAAIAFRMRPTSIPKRQAEAGYTTYGNSATAAFFTPNIRSLSGNRIQATPAASATDVSLYTRQDFDIQSGVDDGIKIYKNVPINPLYLPVPYYLPDDFGIAEIPWRGAVVGDTVTISGTEVWTIVQAAVNQVTFSAICLLARTT